MKKTLCFTGHRSIPAEEEKPLAKLLSGFLEEKFAEGYTCFRTGGAVGFDTEAALAVLRLRKKHSEVRLELFLPCKDQTKGWNVFDRLVYDYIRRHANEVTYMTEHYDSYCMFARNRALVEGSDLCVAYLKTDGGGTAYTVKYAEDQGVPVLNLADQIPELV